MLIWASCRGKQPMNRLVVSTIFVLPQNMRNPLDQYFVVGKLATTSFATRSPFGAKGLNRRNTEDPLCRVQNSPLSLSYRTRRCSCDMTSWHTELWHVGSFFVASRKFERSAQSIARYDKWNSGFGCFWYLHQTIKSSHIHWFLFNSLRRSNPLKPMDLTKHGWRPIFPASVSTEILAMTQIRKHMCLFLRTDSLEEIGG
jgi:hypothetical protein